MTRLLLLVVSVILTTANDANAFPDISETRSELYLVAPGRLYSVKRQFDGFGASAGQAGSQSFKYSPQGFNAAQSLFGSQTYKSIECWICWQL